jgi:farnesyl-diphosphate farnesyltransferase
VKSEAELGTRVLKSVSRSFYLSLRLLPVEMREGAALGYLLARASDTIADTVGVPVEARLGMLSAYSEVVAMGAGGMPDFTEVAAACEDGERVLLEQLGPVLDWLGRLPGPITSAVRKVVAVIVSGQRLDLERFGRASAREPVCLATAEELDDYCQRVAGCVGGFWTELGFAALGGRFSSGDPARLCEMGCRYGRALQLVNILRDMPKDLRDGRCYLPGCDPADRVALMGEHRVWRRKAEGLLQDGFCYAESLRGARLRAASVLPAMLARKTLDRLATADWAALEARVKIPRRAVYAALVRSFLP